MRGLQGQKFDFFGKGGVWNAIFLDESFAVNMRVTVSIPELEDMIYITGLGVSIVDESGGRERWTRAVDFGRL